MLTLERGYVYVLISLCGGFFRLLFLPTCTYFVFSVTVDAFANGLLKKFRKEDVMMMFPYSLRNFPSVPLFPKTAERPSHKKTKAKTIAAHRLTRV